VHVPVQHHVKLCRHDYCLFLRLSPAKHINIQRKDAKLQSMQRPQSKYNFFFAVFATLRLCAGHCSFISVGTPILKP
jgi:hypothetical protein